ncbi:MAG: DUF2141 domain-containing protein [Terriglobales bacterium]
MKSAPVKSNRIAFYSLLGCALLAAAGQLQGQTQATPAPAPTPTPSATPAATPTPAPEQAVSNLTVKIAGIRNAKGRINIALFKDGKGFPSDVPSAVAAQRVDIDPQTLSATAVFKNLPQGNYAAAVLHDENLTGKMDFDAQGIPQEGYGISNNPDTTGGPPTPEDAKFVVDKPESAIEIKMTYWN